MDVARSLISGFAILLAALPGCTEGSPGEASTTAAIVPGYIGQQGRLLLGFKDPDVRVFSFPSIPDTHAADGGQLVGTGVSGQGYTGVAFTATSANNATPVNMRITQVISPVAPDVEWQYVLEQLDPVTGTWGAACDAPVQLVPPIVPPVTPIRAIAMPGAWTADGVYITTAVGPSFACKTGVAAKCDGWGYPVTAVPPTVTVLGLATSATGADMMQACTRMARADYCALGMPNTIDGTPIHIDDVFTSQPPVAGYPFEAAWPGVAFDRAHGLQRPPVVCLSKLRWSTLPLGGDCPLLPDPRTNAKGQFCEDLSPLTLELRGALVFSSSAYIDAGLYTYTDPTTSTRLTTASLLPQAVGQLPAWQIPAPAGVPFPVAGEAVQFEATVLAPTLPAVIPATGLVQLISYRCASDLLTTTTQPADPSCQPIAVEGYVYPPNTAGRAPLRRWHSPTTQHAYTTAAAASTMIASQWKLDEVVGGVIRAAIDVNVRWSSLAGSVYTLDVETRAGEWIPSCIDSATIGTATRFVYHGVCVGAANRAVNHADIVAFRVTATSAGQSTIATQAYDGFSSDAYVALANGATTAIAVHWNALSNASYAVDMLVGLNWQHCADTSVLANDTSYVHTGPCVSLGTTIAIHQISELRVCAFDRTTQQARGCGVTKYDGRASQVAVAVK